MAIQENLRKFFYVDISTSSPNKILEDISTWKFPSYFPQNFKTHYNDIGSILVVWNESSDDLMSFSGELKLLQVWRKFPLISPLIWKFPGISVWILVSPTTQISTLIPSTIIYHPRGFPAASARLCQLGATARQYLLVLIILRQSGK